MTQIADTKFRREANRGSHDYKLACQVLDAGKICHCDFSVKCREGDPSDAKGDMDAPIWAGVVPLTTTAEEPIDSADLLPGIGRPNYL